MTTFILVRHAESAAKERNLVQGKGLDMPLTESGLKQARRLADVLKDEHIDRIFTSTAKRTIDTAAPLIAIRPNTPVEAIYEFHERSKGDAEGMDKKEFARVYADIEAAWAREEDPRPAGGESFADVEGRVMPVIQSHAQKYPGERLLYVGHGNVFR